jgi:ATP-dependent Clp protease ATP-binding subunit ClpC
VRDSALGRFTRDLTEDARAGRLDPVRCRDAEIARVIDILLRYGKNNPALAGPAGVGKTAIVEGLAQRVVAGDVPLSLRGVRVLSLDHVALLGGTTYRGQYESRITALVDEVTRAGDVILFVDELHNLIGQGTAMGVAMDAGNMLKPALVRGEFRVIGATTSDEYDRWICGDPALERRFQRVDVRELSAADTVDVLRARVLRLERHHGVVIADDAIDAAVRLTDEYVTDRARPDRAIDALDEACAHTQARVHYGPAVATLLAERRGMLRRGTQEAEMAGAPAGDGGEDDTDPLERFARSGFDALERFGAGLEAAIVERLGDPAGRSGMGRPRPVTPTGAGSGGADSASDTSATAQNAGARVRPIAELDEAIRRHLIEDGVVVRGHDVARAVAVATGNSVVWCAT